MKNLLWLTFLVGCGTWFPWHQKGQTGSGDGPGGTSGEQKFVSVEFIVKSLSQNSEIKITNTLGETLGTTVVRKAFIAHKKLVYNPDDSSVGTNNNVKITEITSDSQKIDDVTVESSIVEELRFAIARAPENILEKGKELISGYSILLEVESRLQDSNIVKNYIQISPEYSFNLFLKSKVPENGKIEVGLDFSRVFNSSYFSGNIDDWRNLLIRNEILTDSIFHEAIDQRLPLALFVDFFEKQEDTFVKVKDSVEFDVSVSTNSTNSLESDKSNKSESRWEFQLFGRSPILDDIVDFHFFDTNRGFAITDDSKLLETTDGGTSWKTVPLPSKNGLNSISFTNDSIGWIGTQSGTPFKTEDGGKSWQSHDQPLIWRTHDIEFVDANKGFVVGFWGMIGKTIDAGKTWTMETREDLIPLNEIFFLDNQHGWMVGYDGLILWTNDGGEIWNEVKVNTSEITDVHFIDKDIGYAVGVQGYLAKSSDGGKTWEQLSIDYKGNIVDVTFTSPEKGFISTISDLLITNDGGTTWQSVGFEEDLGGVYRKIQFIDEKIGVAMGDSGTLIKTTDGGENWVFVTQGPIGTFNSADFPSPGLGFAVNSNGEIFRITDKAEKIYQADQNALRNIQFLDDQTGWVSGSDGMVFKTTDSGLTWSQLQTPVDAHLESMHFIDKETGFFGISAYSQLLKTTDSGKTWEVLDIKSGNFVARGIYFLTKNKGFIVGENSTIKMTVDGGVTWVDKYSEERGYLFDIYFVDDQFGWAVGQSRVVTTTDGGNSWTLQENSTNSSLMNIHFINRLEGFSVGSPDSQGQTIYRSTDSGLTWHPINKDSPFSSREVFPLSPVSFWSFGENGSIFKFDQGQ